MHSEHPYLHIVPFTKEGVRRELMHKVAIMEQEDSTERQHLSTIVERWAPPNYVWQETGGACWSSAGAR